MGWGAEWDTKPICYTRKLQLPTHHRGLLHSGQEISLAALQYELLGAGGVCVWSRGK